MDGRILRQRSNALQDTTYLGAEILHVSDYCKLASQLPVIPRWEPEKPLIHAMLDSTLPSTMW